MSSRFGDRSWEMEGNVLDAEKKNTSGQGYNASTFTCPSCGFRRQSVEHRKRKGLCSKELQDKYYDGGGL